MNRNITRGLALAALTGGFTILGATAANAIDLPDLGGGNGGLLGTGIDLGGTSTDGTLLGDVDVPLVVDGLNLSVLGGTSGAGAIGTDSLSLGEGILVNTGRSNADILSDLGIDTTGLLGENEVANAVVGVPLNVSNTWASILGTQPNGIVVVPNASGGALADTDGVLDSIVTVPVDISCSSVTVLSDYQNECAGGTPGTGGSTGGGILDGGALGGGILDGDLLGDDPLGGNIIDGNLLDGELLGDANGDGQITIEDRQLGVLDGDTLGEGLTPDGDGVLVDFGDSTDAGDPLNLSNAWLSALGANEGVVVVPDLTLDLSLLTGGLISHEILAPIVIDCVTVTVLSDYERDCASGPTEPEEPTVPEEPTTPVVPAEPGADNGGDNTGGTDGTDGITDPCDVIPAAATTEVVAQPVSLAVFAAAALAGALAAVLLMLLGRRLGRQQ